MSERKCLGESYINIYNKSKRDWIKDIHYHTFGLQLRTSNLNPKNQFFLIYELVITPKNKSINILMT